MKNLLYSIAAVRRVLGLGDRVRVKIAHWFKVLWIWAEGSRPTLLSKSALKQHFVEFRKQQAKNLVVAGSGSRYQVGDHRVGVEAHGLTCTCQDFAVQSRSIGRGVCKHGYAVLNHLGYDSLSVFITASQAA